MIKFEQSNSIQTDPAHVFHFIANPMVKLPDNEARHAI